MATIGKTSDGPPDITQGILMPMLQNKWRMAINSRLEEWTDIAMQIVRCKVNYKTRRITAWIEQGSRGELCTLLYDLMHTSFHFRLDCLDGNEHTYFSTEFMNTKIVDHDLDYDYASGNVLTHTLEMSFEGIQILEPERSCKPPRIKV